MTAYWAIGFLEFMLMKVVATIHLKITLLKSYTSLVDNAITKICIDIK